MKRTKYTAEFKSPSAGINVLTAGLADQSWSHPINYNVNLPMTSLIRLG